MQHKTKNRLFGSNLVRRGDESESGQIEMKQVKLTYFYAYGSVSAGREKWPFRVYFFSQKSRRLLQPNQKILMTSIDLY